MDRTGASLLTLVRLALAAAMVGVTSLVPAAVLATTVPTYSLVVLAALTLAVAALLDAGPVMLPALGSSRLPTAWAEDVLPHLAGRSTDVRHHPVRPRAPGLV